MVTSHNPLDGPVFEKAGTCELMSIISFVWRNFLSWQWSILIQRLHSYVQCVLYDISVNGLYWGSDLGTILVPHSITKRYSFLYFRDCLLHVGQILHSIIYVGRSMFIWSWITFFNQYTFTDILNYWYTYILHHDCFRAASIWVCRLFFVSLGQSI